MFKNSSNSSPAPLKSTPLDICHCQKKEVPLCFSKDPKEGVENFLCLSCGFLRPYSLDITFFELLGVPYTYDLCEDSITQSYLKRQLFFHPDRWRIKSPQAQSYAEQYSASINEAYKTLRCPFLRGSYLLSLQVDSPLDVHAETSWAVNALNGPLESFFDLQERLERLTSSEERALEKQSLLNKKSGLIHKISTAFKEKKLTLVKTFLEEERFLMRALELLDDEERR